MRTDRLRRFGAWARARGRAFGFATRDVMNAVARSIAEVALVLALLAGWASMTYGVASLPVFRARVVWSLSVGVLLLSGCGWGYLARIAVVGLYARTRKSTP